MFLLENKLSGKEYKCDKFAKKIFSRMSNTGLLRAKNHHPEDIFAAQ